MDGFLALLREKGGGWRGEGRGVWDSDDDSNIDSVGVDGLIQGEGEVVRARGRGGGGGVGRCILEVTREN